MKKTSKEILKGIIPFKYWEWLKICQYNNKQGSIPWRTSLFQTKVYLDKKPGTIKSAKLFNKMLQQSQVLACHNYLYPFNPLKRRILPPNIATLMSITPDYGYIIKCNIQDIKQSIPINGEGEFCLAIKETIENIEHKAILLSTQKYKNKRYQYLASLFPNILYRDCETLEEALQKLLFYNGLFWQAGHFHNGLGRLDMILYPYYKHDIDNGIINRKQAKNMLTNFCNVLGSQTPFKSVSLIGDTGQYILLGGIDQNGVNVDNELTQLFLEIFTEIKVPDPKLILRINTHTPIETWNKALKCIMNGCGSPLFMNESLIMNNMIKFGYHSEDVWNVGTSACWEPLIIGKSSDQNNPFASIIACASLNKAISSGKNYPTFESLLNDVKENLNTEAHERIKDKNYDYSPLMSIFMPECIQRGKDFSHKGSQYMYQGAQILGLPNLINSLINIKHYVYDEHIVSLATCREIIINNYNGYEDIQQLFSNGSEIKFGKVHPEILSLTNEIINSISNSISHITANGNPVKFGLSSPNYITQSHSFEATLDGRKAGEPFAVHISPISSSIDINEILTFAENLSYPVNCLNGNVVDFIIPSSYQSQLTKFMDILREAFAQGIFQLQLNVLDKKTLIDAKQHPEKYPTLVVRVWGFSAYFNDLPEEYKDNLIARAEMYETA